MKFLLTLSYDGSRFLGSQSQPHKKSVEDELRKALGHLGIYDVPIMSSRTDKDVHALRQCASIRVNECWKNQEKKLINQINRHLHSSIQINAIREVDDNFHARYDAKARTYRYIFHHGKKTSFNAAYFTHIKDFDTKKADMILRNFEGEHDFELFSKTGSDIKNSIRTILKARCYKRGEYSIILLRANGFLRSQVRLIVAATLKALSLNDRDAKRVITEQIKCIKSFTRMPAPASGLYLSRVHYF